MADQNFIKIFGILIKIVVFGFLSSLKRFKKFCESYKTYVIWVFKTAGSKSDTKFSKSKCRAQYSGPKFRINEKWFFNFFCEVNDFKIKIHVQIFNPTSFSISEQPLIIANLKNLSKNITTKFHNKFTPTKFKHNYLRGISYNLFPK